MLRIGAINNMSPAAIPGTERQIIEVLDGAAASQRVRYQLKWFRLAGARPENYGDLEDLLHCDLDGLIITGCEPRAASLPDEPVWKPLVRVIEWASRRTASTIFSCLSAHAGVLYLDGIERQPQPRKIFGLFTSTAVCDDALTRDLPPSWVVPHSRWNDLPQDELTQCGYEILVTSAGAGVDTFTKRVRRSRFVFVLSHPEYEAGSLLMEYRRDAERYYFGKRLTFPSVPQNFFDTRVEAELEALRHRGTAASRARMQSVLERVSLPQRSWKPVAVQLYANWFDLLAAGQHAALQTA